MFTKRKKTTLSFWGNHPSGSRNTSFVVTFVPELLYLFRTNPLLILAAFTRLRFSHLITSRDGEGLQGLRSPQKTEEARSTIVRYRLGSVLMGRLWGDYHKNMEEDAILARKWNSSKVGWELYDDITYDKLWSFNI